MPITLTCPRCKAPLNLPDTAAGQYAFCQKCEGRIWVPKDAAKPQSAAQASGGGKATTKQQGATDSDESAAATATQAPPDTKPAEKVKPPQVVDPMAPVAPAAPASNVASAGQPPAAQSTAGSKPPPPPPGAQADGHAVPPTGSAPPTATLPTSTGKAPPREQTSQPDEAKPPGQATPPRPGPPAQQPAAQPQKQPAQSVPSQPAAQTAARPARRVATFITADVAQSQLEPAEDGQLPALQLEEADKKTKKPPSTSTVQWRMVLLICGSLSLAAIQLLDFGGDSRNVETPADQARNELYNKYIGEEGDELKTYQLYLREALVSHDRGHYKRERYYYRKVLHLLRDEHHDRDKNGLTGIRTAPDGGALPSDERLEDLLSMILRSR